MDAHQVGSLTAHQISRLTARWLDALPDTGSTVLSGYGVAPLLAILASLADEPARSELSAALHRPPTTELSAVDGLLLPRTAELRAAVALWTRPEVPLEPGLDKVVPPDLRGVLENREALDHWVVEQTDGLLRRMPVELNPDVLLVLASALAVRTTWALPFMERKRYVDGRSVWWLSRSDTDLDTVRLHSTPAGPLTGITVRGTGEIDVRLVIGEPGAGRTAVLAAALSLSDAGAGGRELLQGLPAPGVRVIESMAPTPTAILSVPYFEVDAEHDLMESAEVFGLVAASDSSRGHFPGLSPRPLAVDQAKQAVMVRFSAKGFEAAAVTATPVAAGSAPRPGGKALLIELDRPFGFVAVHRPTGIPLVTGWVTDTAYLPV